MNNWLNRLERKYGRYGIPNLTNILVAGQILVLAIELFVDRTIPYWLGLSRSLLLQGQIWRVISFVFIPFSGGSILSVVLGIYFTWFVGTALEREWGDFRYTVYLLSGVLGTVLGCLLTGVTASTYCLSLSLLLAFAMLYPEVQLLLFFVIPIRVKYFGIFAAVLWVFSFLGASLPGKLDYLLSMLIYWKAPPSGCPRYNRSKRPSGCSAEVPRFSDSCNPDSTQLRLRQTPGIWPDPHTTYPSLYYSEMSHRIPLPLPLS